MGLYSKTFFMPKFDCVKNYLFKSKRIGFRKWNDSDRLPFSEMNSDPAVMEFFPALLSPEESDNFYNRIQDHFREFGFGLYAVDILGSSTFVGYVGFQKTRFDASFTPCFEIGWRLAPLVWGKGIATEAGLRCLDYGFFELELKKICSFTAVANTRAQRVIEKIGMSKIGEFEHPKLEEENWLRKHVLYNIERPTFN